MVAVRYYSHLQQRTGYGRAALELAQAMDIGRFDLELRTIGPRDADQVPRSNPIEKPDAIIVHTLPGDCHRVLEIEGLRRGAGPKLIAYTTWEALTVPGAISGPLFGSFDQVWVPSATTAAAFAVGRGPAPAGSIHVVPHCYDDSAPLPGRSASSDGIFRFYWIGAWTARKNPQGLIRAFAHAFSREDAVELILHSPGCSTEAFVAALATTGMSQDELPTITLSQQRLTEGAMSGLHANSECFVTAARGEAWNLPAFDALRAGRHIITQYGLGSDEFLSDTSADLIDGWESPAQVDVEFQGSADGVITVKTVGAQGLSARTLWLEPNLSSLALSMQAAHESKRRTIDIAYDLAQRFGYAAVAEQILNVLEEP